MELQQETSRIRQWLAAGLRFALVTDQVVVQGPKSALNADDAQWLREHKIHLRQLLLTSPEQFAEASWPASDAQAAMWIANRLTPDMCAYNLVLGLRLHTALDEVRLTTALRQLLQRHDGLRTCLFETADGLSARLMPVVVPPLQDLNARGLSPAQLLDQIAQWSDAAFDLSQGPLLQVMLIRDLDTFQQAALDFNNDGQPINDLLLVKCHHLAVDLWGLQLLLRELQQRYASPASTLAPAPAYRRFNEWQATYLRSPQGERDAEFWQEHWLANPLLDQPWQASARHRSFRGARVSKILTGEQSERLRQLASHFNTTPFVLILTAFSAVEARYHGRTDAIIGSPVAGRSSPQAEHTIGHFVNLLTQRVPVTASSWSEQIALVREHWQKAMQHADYPFPRILAALQASQSIRPEQLPEAVLVWHQAGTEWLQRMLGQPSELLQSVNDVWSGSGQRGAAYPLVLAVLDRGHDYRLEWTFDDGLFDARAMQQRVADFLAGFQSLLHLDPVDPTHLPLQTPSRLDGGAPVTHTLPDTLWQRIDHHCQHNPDGTAVFDVVTRQAVTWQQLLDRAEALAAHLTQLGVVSGDRIGLWLARSIHWPLACVACWRLNAAFVPLDTAAPTARLDDILVDAGIDLIITDNDQHPHDLETGALWVVLTQSETFAGSPPLFVPDTEASAYVIYTSGSSGRPKGVAVSQRNLLTYSDGFESLCRQPAQSIASLTPYTFDVSLFELGGSLLQGREMVLLPDVLALDRDHWQALLFQRPIDMLYIPPGLLDGLRDAWRNAGAPLPSRLMSGVEPIAYATFLRWLELRADMDVFNQYGPTETTVAATWYRITPESAAAHPSERVPLGLPMPGSRVELHDLQQRPVPLGCNGEAYILGAQVAQGYIGHAASGDSRFSTRADGVPCYRTGDWMRINPQGQLLYLGRADQQVKIRGVRIELGEVRAALLALTDVTGAWVEVRRHESGTPFLVAHVATDIDHRTLLTRLRLTLPPLLVPAALITHRELPLNRHGKVDAAALTATPLSSAAVEQRLPQTAAEQALWEAWCQELPQPPRHVAENFFMLGGQSLIAARIASRLLAAGYLVAVADLLTHLDIESQASCLRQPDQSHHLARATGTIAISGEATPFQFSLWAHENLNGPTRAYSVPLVCRFTTPISTDMVIAQWSRLMLRHEALRTRFVEVEMGLQQQVLNQMPLPVITQDILLTDDAAAASTQQDLIHQCLEQPLAMTTAAPLWRVHWFPTANGGLMVALFHHSIFDGASIQALAEEWQSGAFQQQVQIPAMVEAVAAINATTRALHTEGLAFWRDALSDRDMPDLPRRESPLAQDEPALGVLSRPLSAAHLKELEQTARQLGCTPFCVALTLYQLVLARFNNHGHGAVAIPVDLRDAVHRPVVGGLVNTLAIPCNFDWEDSLTTAIGKTWHFLQQAHPYRSIPLDQIGQAIGVSTEHVMNTLFATIFVWEETPANIAGQPVEWLRAFPTEAKADIELVVGSHGIHVLWRANRYEQVTLESLLDSYGYLVQNCAALLPQRTGWLPLFDQAQLVEQTTALCGTGGFEPLQESVMDLIQASVERTPEHTAVGYLHEQTEYRALQQQALRFAAGLRQRGVTQGDRVAFCLARRADTIAALLAIWQTGAAYVPLDPRWPDERRNRVLEAADCRCILVNALDDGSARTDLPCYTLTQLDADTDLQQPLRISSLDQTAYVLFTSGSTGTPKGVVISHANLAAFMRWVTHFYPAEDFAGFLAVTTFAFDISVFEIFGTLCSGGTLYLGEDPLALLDPAVQEAYSGKLTFLCSVPSAAMAWLDAGVIPSGIRTVNMGGEFLPQSIVERFYQAGVGRVLDLWGPTEDTTYSMVAWRRPGGLPHIGKPITDTQMWVVDSRLQPQPRGVKGELLLGGFGLSAGYLNAPELTARAFIDNPFHRANPNWVQRVYRTGDLGWQDAEDHLHYCARADFQLKLNGQRLEAGEIETCLRQHPSVRTVVIQRHEEMESRACLLAFIEPEPGQTCDIDTLSAFVRSFLPAYMVPAKWLVMAQWPLNANGKIDRRQLSLIAASSTLLTTSRNEIDTIAFNPLEETLLEICNDLLPGQPLSLTCPVDQSGLDSISLLRLNFAIQKKLQLPNAIPLSVWLQHRTLRAVATYLQQDSPIPTWTRLNDAPASAPVLACIHAVGGEITGFRRLAKALEQHWQVWAVALPPDHHNIRSLQALAARYVQAWDEINTPQVTLLGYSLGGLIAAHMIAPLQARGVTLRHLIMLDSHTSEALNANAVVRSFPSAVREDQPQWQLLYEIAVSAGWVPAGLPLEAVIPRLQAVAHLLDITLPETLPPIAAPVLHIASTVDEHAARQHWQRYCECSLQYYSTPAWHGAVLDADYLQPLLDVLEHVHPDAEVTTA